MATATVAPPYPRAFGALLRLFCALAALPVLLAATALAFYGAAFEDRIYPNVAVGGVNVGGLPLEAARATLHRAAADVLARPLVLRGGVDAGDLTLSALGVSLTTDALESAARAAHDAGRTTLHDPASLVRHHIHLLRNGEHIPVALEFDAVRAHTALDAIAERVNRPAANAHLKLVPTEQSYELHMLPAVAGQRVDREATLERLREWLGSGTALSANGPGLTLDVVTEPITPIIGDDDVATLRATVNAAAGAPLVFVSSDGQSWAIEPAALSTALRLEGLDPLAYYAPPASMARPALVLDDTRLAVLIASMADAADRPAEEPRLEVRGDRVGVRAGRPGRLVDRVAALASARGVLAAAGGSGADGAVRRITLRFSEHQPAGAPLALEPAAQWVNDRLAVPIVLEFQDTRRTLSRTDLIKLLALRADAPGLDRAAVRAFLAASLPAWVRLERGAGPVEPSLELRAGRVEIVPGRVGQALDLEALAAELTSRFALLDPAERAVSMTPITRAPRVTAGDLVSARDAAQALVSEPVQLYSSVGDWSLAPEALLSALHFERLHPDAIPSGVLDRDRIAPTVTRIVREAEARANTLGLRDDAGRPLRIDVTATADEVVKAAWSRDGERYAPIRWLGEL
ncbi:MAG: peptidoglycan binding domain-containing protein [Chloroflexota bacterium]